MRACSPSSFLLSGPLLREAALVGDMRELRVDRTTRTVKPHSLADRALRLCCWMNSEERRLFTRPFEGDEEEESLRKYRHFLPMLGDVLHALDAEAETKPLPPARAQRGRDELAKGDAEYGIVLRDVERLHRCAQHDGERDFGAAVERWDDLGVVVVTAEHAPHYYALFSLAAGADAVVTLLPGNRYEVEYRYTGFVDLQSRPTWPRLNLAHLAKALNAREQRGGESPPEVSVTSRTLKLSRGIPAVAPPAELQVTPQGVQWDAPGVTDSGPLLRLNDPKGRLTKAERYGNPDERPIWSSTIPRAEFLAVVKSFFEFGTRQAKRAPGVRGKVPRRGWTWRETHAVNAHVDWDKWAASQTKV